MVYGIVGWVEFTQFLKFTTTLNNDLLAGLSVLGSVGLDLLDNGHGVLVGKSAEDNVLAIKPLGLCCAEEELGSVGVWSAVGHGEDSWSGVLQVEVLVGEFLPVDALTSGSILSGEVTTLAHELWDDTVEGGSFVSVSLLSGAEGSEVLAGLGNNVSVQDHVDSANWFTIGGDVEVASFLSCWYCHDVD